MIISDSFKIQLKQYLRPLYNRLVVMVWSMKGRKLPPPHSLKQEIINKIRKKYRYSTLIETGTFKGDMIEAQRRNFNRLYSIELSHELYINATERFKKFNHVIIIEGDSGIVLKTLIKQINEPAVLWLDGHYSGGITAKGELNCPVYKELDAIFENSELHHAILIDDARHFTGEADYPSTEELEEYVRTKNSLYSFSIEDDIIFILP